MNRDVSVVRIGRGNHVNTDMMMIIMIVNHYDIVLQHVLRSIA